MFLIVPLFLVLSSFFLALGLVLPLVRFEKLIFFSETPSLLGIVLALWEQESWVLALMVALFSVVFPLLKLVGIAMEVTAESRTEASGLIARLMPVLSRWSMMDVMLVALVIVAAKTSGVASAFIPSLDDRTL